METYIEPHRLAALMTKLTAEGGERDVRVVDVRWALDDDTAGHTAYRRGHLPGAVYLGWLTDWSDPADPVPGQLAGPEAFADTMGRAGIGPDTTVVAYDDGRLYLASRLSWALRHYGHREVSVLDGGYPAWVAAGLPVSTDVPTPSARRYPCRGVRRLRYKSVKDVSGCSCGMAVDAVRQPYNLHRRSFYRNQLGRVVTRLRPTSPVRTAS